MSVGRNKMAVNGGECSREQNGGECLNDQDGGKWR